MTARFRIEPLGGGHRRQGFSSGVAALDRYIAELATQDIKRRVSNCFVVVDADGALAGYYTFAATSIPLGDLTEGDARKLPRYPLLPAALIGRLAIDRRFQGQRLGGSLIMDAAGRAVRADTAIFALVVDAKDDAAVRFYEHQGFRRFASKPMSLYVPIATALKALTGIGA